MAYKKGALRSACAAKQQMAGAKAVMTKGRKTKRAGRMAYKRA